MSGNRRLPRSHESSSDEHVVLFRNFSFDDFGAELDWSTRTNSHINRIRNLINLIKVRWKIVALCSREIVDHDKC